MRLTYHDLVGRQVIDSNGKRIGRVADLRAERRQGHLCIIGLLVGGAGVLSRLGLDALAMVAAEVGVPDYYVTMNQVAGLGVDITLSVPLAELKRRIDGGFEE